MTDSLTASMKVAAPPAASACLHDQQRARGAGRERKPRARERGGAWARTLISIIQTPRLIFCMDNREWDILSGA